MPLSPMPVLSADKLKIMKTTAEISGHTILPLSGKPAKGLIVLLHGYGGTGSGLYRSLASLRAHYPEMAFAVPDGPFLLYENSFAWIRLTFPIDPQALWEGVTLVAPQLNEYIDHELGLLELNNDHLILMGFSQGAIMALHIGLRRENAPWAVIAMAGFLVGEQHLEEIISKPPVYLISGDSDEVVTPAVVAASGRALMDHGIKVHQTLVNGLGHKINQQVLEDISEILDGFYDHISHKDTV